MKFCLACRFVRKFICSYLVIVLFYRSLSSLSIQTSLSSDSPGALMAENQIFCSQFIYACVYGSL